uniref:Microtubule-associated protein 1 light chain 3 gamma, like n=1 Tax=Hucho hucho TaxID=62062 RepID=A0A4W5NF84_9TELE
MPPFEKSMELMPFKLRKYLVTRKHEVCSIRIKLPNKLHTLPLLDKTKFLVPFELTLGQFLCLLRSKIDLESTQALYLLVSEKSMSCMSSSMGEVYSQPIGFPVINLLPDLPDYVTSLFPACTVAFLDPLCMTFCLPLDPATCLLLWSFTINTCCALRLKPVPCLHRVHYTPSTVTRIASSSSPTPHRTCPKGMRMLPIPAEPELWAPS